MAIVYRIGNGSALTYTEVDGNFRYLLSNMSGSIVAITGSTHITGSLSVLPEGTVNQLTSSWAISSSHAITASYAANASVSNVVFTNLGEASTQTVEGNVRLTGDIIAEQYIVSSSVVHYTESFASGSHIFGDDSLDTHQFTGSVLITGSITSTPTIINSLTASYAMNARSSSYALTASHALNAGGGGLWTASNGAITRDSEVQITGSLIQSNGEGNAVSNPERGNVAFGKDNVIGGGWNAFAHGIGNTAGSSYSHAEGSGSSATAVFAHAEGFNTIADGYASHTEGLNSRTDGSYSHAEGAYTSASGDHSHAEGYYTIASGIRSHAEGRATLSDGPYAHAEGYLSTASGDYSHAEGYGTQTTTLGDYAHAEGNSTIAKAFWAHTEGGYTTATANYAHTEGYYTTASGQYSHAEGSGSVAQGKASHAAGIHTIAKADGQNVVGSYNISNNTDSLFVIGDGTSDGARADLLRANTGEIQITGSLRNNGDAFVIGDTQVTGSIYVDDAALTFSGKNGALGNAANLNLNYAARFTNITPANGWGVLIDAGGYASSTKSYPLNVRAGDGTNLFLITLDNSNTDGKVNVYGNFEVDGTTTLAGDNIFFSPDLPSMGNSGTSNTRRDNTTLQFGVASSTRRIKKNITPFTMSADFKNNLLNIQVKNFQMKFNDVWEDGLIAEEVYELVPELVSLSKDYVYDEKAYKVKDDNGNYVTSSNDMVPANINDGLLPYYLLEVIKDQQKEINDLASRIAALE